MSWSEFVHLFLGFVVGLLPTIFRVITNKLNQLDSNIDPVEQAIIEASIRKHNAAITSPEKPDNSTEMKIEKPKI